MRDVFSSFHPIVNFIYFVLVIMCSMFFMHPVFLGISLCSAILYSIYLNGIRAIKFNFLFMLPVLLLFAALNPLFNHEGATVLFHIQNNPITAEALIYGLAAAAMFVSVIIWFSCYNVVMTSDKFIFLFGRVIPALSLVLSMVLRLIPRLKAQIHMISNAQKCVGQDATNGNMLQRVKNGLKILSVLVTWAFENAIDTADSMKSRGYGLKGRTSFSNYRFDRRDGLAMGFILFFFLPVIFGALTGENNIIYFPSVLVKPLSAVSLMVYIAYGGLCLLPLIFNILEDIKWARLKSRV